MSLGGFIAERWQRFQGELFPFLAEAVGPLGERRRRFVAVADPVPAEGFLPCGRGGPGRPSADRGAMARAFAAKAVWDIPTTSALIDRLRYDPTLRRLCG